MDYQVIASTVEIGLVLDIFIGEDWFEEVIRRESPHNRYSFRKIILGDNCESRFE